MKIKKLICLVLTILCLNSNIGIVFADDPAPSMTNKFGIEGTAGGTGTGYTINGVEKVGQYKITSSVITHDANDSAKAKDLLDKYRGIISFLAGAGALTMLLFFIINFGKLGASAGNPQQRQSALMGLLFTGIATAILGSIMIFFQFFYHAFD